MAKKVHKIDRVLRGTLRKLDLEVKLEGYRIWLVWSDIVGEQIATRTQPDRLRNRILFVKVSSSTWMQQLQTMKPMLLERIHKVVRGTLIEDIRFSIGEVIPSASPSVSIQREVEAEETKLSAEMETCLGQIQDNELRSLMRNVMSKRAGRTVRREVD